jgi:hypothetical protein
VPLTSNVRPRVNRMRNLASAAVLHRTAVALGGSSRRRVEQHTRCIGVGRPSAGGRRTAAPRQGFLQHRRGLSVLWRPAQRPFISNGARRPNGCVYSTAVPLLGQRVKRRGTRAGTCSVSPRSCVSLLVRGVGASAHTVQSQLIRPTMVVPSWSRSNPSVEGTHNGGARLFASATSAAPSCAPHVKR